MADLVFGFISSPWTFLVFGILWIGLSVLGIKDLDTKEWGIFMLTGVVCLGFVAILWKMPRGADKDATGTPMELTCRTPLQKADREGDVAFLSLNRMTLTFGHSSASGLPATGPSTYAVLEVSENIQGEASYLEAYAPKQYSVKILFGTEESPSYAFLFDCK